MLPQKARFCSLLRLNNNSIMCVCVCVCVCVMCTHPGGERGSPPPAFLPGESRGQRSRGGYSPWGLKESDVA